MAGGPGDANAPGLTDRTRNGGEDVARVYVTDTADYTLDTPSGAEKRGVLLERTRTIKSGDYLECEIFPVVLMDNATRAARRQKSPEAIQRANAERARRHLERLMNANFGPGDLLLHLTMAKPCPYEEMRRELRNYIARLKYKAGKTCTPCKYVYVIETTGEGERMRHHVHMVLSARTAPQGEPWITRDEAEQLWTHGLARCDRAQKQEKGLCGFARYITQRKETQARLMKRSWGASKGLINPDANATVSDRKFSRAAVGRIVADVEQNARALFEKKYPGYRLVEQPVIRYSEFLPGAYVYAFMERRESTRPDGRDAEDGQHGERRASTVRGA